MKSLLKKELKELLSEKTILVGVVLTPLILFPVMGAVLSLSFGQTSGQLLEDPLIVVDNDGGEYARLFVKALESSGFRPEVLSSEPDGPQQLFKKHSSDVFIIVNRGFTKNLTMGTKASVDVYLQLSSMSFSAFQKITQTMERISAASTILGEAIAAESGIQLEFFKNPVEISGGILYREAFHSTEDLNGLFQTFFATGFFIPLVLLVVVATSGTIAATSVALEKEAKTLEILMTFPISRTSILLSKLLGSTMVALLGTASMVVGLVFYLSSLPIPAVPVSGLQVRVSPIALVLLGILLFVTLTITLSLGILAGVLAGDVRGGQQLAGLIQLPLLLPPMLLLLFTDLSTLPQTVSTVMLLNPFTHMMLAIQALSTESYTTYFLHLGAITLFMATVLAVASLLFKGERLLTMRIKISRTRSIG
ncbi:MAG: ABC transporter permease [Candidatus Caldarchaeum sp.]|nr:ABC transporter permease [Candidatus Caldarchaeum sp.]